MSICFLLTQVELTWEKKKLSKQKAGASRRTYGFNHRMKKPSLEHRSLGKVLKHQTSELAEQPLRQGGGGERARKGIHFNTDLHQFVAGSLETWLSAWPSEGSLACRAFPIASLPQEPCSMSCAGEIPESRYQHQYCNQLVVVSGRTLANENFKSPTALCRWLWTVLQREKQ